jgi:hypothetical protein
MTQQHHAPQRQAGEDGRERIGGYGADSGSQHAQGAQELMAACGTPRAPRS